MSTEIDSKVVEMQFDSRNFEENVGSSLTALDKLKAALNFNGLEKSFDNIEKASGNISFEGFSSAINSVSLKFNALEIAAVTAITNITNSAVNAGEQLIKSLSIDNIAAGWDKFSDKTVSVGTLVSQGFDIETVTKQLERLNWYTDETSYNFTDMVSNIAKFTATGQDLETSVTAMEGIANWAALSGQNAQTASRAMYNISQAMGAGSMKLIDYKSIQNASMDTDEFRQKVLDAAVELGTLKKTANDTYQTLDGKGVFTKSQFTSELAKGWFDKDVMMKVFNEYSSVVDQLYDYTNETGTTAAEAIDELGDNLDEFGVKAFKAAQEARTWTDVLDSVKDAVSTGWMNTFENIFGNYEEAKQLWTDLANELYDVFAEGGNQRNEVLSEWKNLGGRTTLITTFWRAFHSLIDVVDLVKEAFRDVFPETTAVRLVSITDQLSMLTRQFKMSDETADSLKHVLETLFTIFDLGIKTIAAVAKGFYPLIDAVKIFAKDFLYINRPFGDIIVSFDEASKKLKIFEEITYQVSRAVNILAGYLRSLVANNVHDFFIGFNKDGNILSGIVTMLIGNIGNLIKLLLSLFSELTGIDTSGMQNAILSGMTNVVGLLRGGLKTIQKIFGEIFKSIAGLPFEDALDSLFEVIGKVFINIKNVIENLFKSLKDTGKISDFTDDIKKNIQALSSMNLSGLENLAASVKQVFMKLVESFNAPSFDKILEIVRSGAFVAIASGIQKLIDAITGAPAKLPIIQQIQDGITGMFDGINASLGGFQEKLKADILRSVAVSIGILAASLFVLASIDTESMATSITGFIGAISGLLISMKEIGKFTATVDVKQFIVITSALTGISTAVSVLTNAMTDLAGLDPEGLVKGFGGVAGLITMMTKVSSTMIASAETSKNIISTASAMVILSIALNMLVPPMIIFGKMPIQNIGKGMFTIVGTIALLGTVMKELTASLSGITGLILVAMALNMLIPPMLVMGNMPIENIGKGMFAMVGSIALLSTVLKGVTSSLSGIAGLIAMAAALNMLIPPMLIFGNMPIENIGKGIFAMAGTIALLSVVLKDLSASLSGIAGLILVATALNMLIPPMLTFGNMPIDGIGKAMFAMVGSIALIGVALNAISTSISGVVVLTLATVAMNAFIPVVLTFSSLNLTQIGTMMLTFAAGLVALVGGMFIISKLSGVLAPAIPILWNAAGSVLTFALGLDMLAPALLALGIVGVKVVYDIIDALHIFADNSTQIVADLKILLEDIARLIPDVIGFIILGVLEGLNDFMAPLLEVIMNLCIGVLNILDQYAEPLINIVIDTVLDLLEAIANKAGDIVQAVVDILIAVIDGLADSLVAPENAQRMRDAIDHFLWNMFDAIKVFLGINSPSTKMEWIGNMMIEGLRVGIIGTVDKVMSSISSLFTAIWNFVKENITNFPQIFKMGMDTIKGYMSSGYEEIKNGLKTAMLGVGDNLIGGFVEGISNAKTKAIEAVKGFGTDAVDKLKELLKIHSPSEVLEKIGEFFGLGFGDGVSGVKDKVKNTVSDFGQNAVDGLSGLSGDFYDKGEEDGFSYCSGWNNAIDTWAEQKRSLTQEQLAAGAYGAIADAELRQKYLIEGHDPEMIRKKQMADMAARNDLDSEKTNSTDDVLNDYLGSSDESDLEKKLKADLEQIDILYNTGAIKTEEEYHKRRLAVLQAYKGEWTKQTSAWLKAERDWFAKQQEQTTKATKATSKNPIAESAKSFGDVINEQYEKYEKKYDALLDKYKQGLITRDQYDRKYNQLLADSLFARTKLQEHADTEMREYTESMLQGLNDDYESKLSDIQSKIDSFNDNIMGDFGSQFTFKTASDVATESYNNAVEDQEIIIRQLQKKRDEVVKLYGEDNSYAQKLQKQIDAANKSLDKYEERHKKREEYYGDETLMTLYDKMDVLDEQRDSIVKLYGENNGKARELQKQIKELEKQEDEYLMSDEYRQNRKDREKNKKKADSKIVGVEFTEQLEEDVATLEAYNKGLQKLLGRNVFIVDDIKEMLAGLSAEEGNALVEYLNSLNDQELADISSKWSAKFAASNAVGMTLYQEDVELATSDYVEGVVNVLGELPDSARDIGKKTALDLAGGFSEETANTLAVYGKEVSDIVGELDTAVNKSFLMADTEKFNKKMNEFGNKIEQMLLDKDFNIKVNLIPLFDMSSLSAQMSGVQLGFDTTTANSAAQSVLSSNAASANSLGDLQESVDGNTEALNHFLKRNDDNFKHLTETIEDVTIVIDKDSLVEGLVRPMDEHIGNMARVRSRGG